MEQLNIHATRSEDTYKNRLTVALKAARTCVFEVDLAHQLYTFFENAEDIFGISGEEILAHVQPYSKLSPEEYQRAVSAYFSHPDDAAVIAEAFDRIFSGQQTTYEARMKAGDSEFVWCKLDVVPILENGHPVRMIGVITDISEARKKKELLEQRANLDGFTGLWNKRYAISAIGSVLEQEPDGRHALLVMDVDDFKYFNDTYGHAEGDRLLLALSDRLTATFHEDSIVGWFGGDEFIVFIRNIQNEGELERLHREIERLHFMFTQPLVHGFDKLIGMRVLRPGIRKGDKVNRNSMLMKPNQKGLSQNGKFCGRSFFARKRTNSSKCS